MKLYTTSQAIRILERYPDRGYVFKRQIAGVSSVLYAADGCYYSSSCDIHGSIHKGAVLGYNDWRLVRPKRKRGRSVVVGKVEDGCVKIDSDGQCVLLSGTWTLIAVEKTDG